jgi:hypothetical protein
MTAIEADRRHANRQPVTGTTAVTTGPLITGLLASGLPTAMDSAFVVPPVDESVTLTVKA